MWQMQLTENSDSYFTFTLKLSLDNMWQYWATLYNRNRIQNTLNTNFFPFRKYVIEAATHTDTQRAQNL